MNSTREAPARRADAVRNEERIVEAAMSVLAADPQAGMDEIAAAADVGRATVYRHFSTREDLVEALRERAISDVAAGMQRSRLEDGSATEALERLILAMVELGERYHFLTQVVQPRPPRSDLAAQFVALIRRGQKSGEFSDAVPAEWWIELTRAAVVCASHAVASGESPDRAAASATEALVRGLGGPA